MKKLLLAILLSASFGIIGHVNAAEEPPRDISQSTVTAMVDEIEIPYRILVYAQNRYQGYAVTKADKVRVNDQDMVRLRVDNDDVSTDYTGIYLFYDKDWKLIDNKDIIAPPQPRKVEQKPAPTDKQEPVQTSSQQPAQPTSGRESQDEPKPEPSSDSQNPPADSDGIKPDEDEAQPTTDETTQTTD